MIPRITAILTAVLLLSAPAVAQPSFDCAKASTLVERTICGNAELAKADREMAAAYDSLSGKLSAEAKAHLLTDQLAWIDNRAKACTGGPEDVVRCLRYRYTARIATLKAEGDGPYPFVSAQSLVRTGQVKAVRYRIDAAYPRFDGSSADFSAVNRAFADTALEGAKNATPGKDLGDRESTWTYLQSFMLRRPGPNSVTVETTVYTFTGGAHGSSGMAATLVDLRTGRRAMPADVFLPDVPWQRTLSEIARADLKRQFVERPGFDDSLQPAKFDKLMTDAERYLFKEDALVLLFNQYEVGPYAAGLYTVRIPYARLSGLIRPDGLVQLAPVRNGRGGG
jgi:uncharacterized protein